MPPRDGFGCIRAREGGMGTGTRPPRTVKIEGCGSFRPRSRFRRCRGRCGPPALTGTIGSMTRSPAHRLLALMMVLAFLAGTGRSALGLHECLHHLGHGAGAVASMPLEAGASGGDQHQSHTPPEHDHHQGHGEGHGAPSGDVAGVQGDHGDGHGSHPPGPCTCFGSCACACAPSGPSAGALVAVASPPPPLPFLVEDADLVDPRLVRWDRPPATAPPSTLRVTASS